MSKEQQTMKAFQCRACKRIYIQPWPLQRCEHCHEAVGRMSKEYESQLLVKVSNTKEGAKIELWAPPSPPYATATFVGELIDDRPS